MAYHPIVARIINLLKKNQSWFETFEHEAVTTSEEAARVRPEYSLHQGAKAMIVRIKVSEANKKFVMLVLPADLRFDNQKIKDFYSAKDVRLATVEEISHLTDNVERGGVPPFGNLFNLEVIVDPKLLENKRIVFNAGDRRFSIAMKTEDYVSLVKPRISAIT